MKEFTTYYSADQIIKYLCKIRIMYANKRNKKYLLDKLSKQEKKSNISENAYDMEILYQLDKLLPKRRLWLTNGQRTFKVVKNKQTFQREVKKIDTDEKNREILFNTIRIYLNKQNPPEFIVNLNNFINEIQTSIETKSYEIEKPDIIPEVKETNLSKKNLELKKSNAFECRPISRFTLKDRIVISLTNKFFTELFDDFFEESALAFRAIKDNDPVRKNHHLAIKKIIQYKNLHKEKELYVAECDMKKFYDTVNHKKCLDSFYTLITKAESLYPNINLDNASHLFKKYLDCYTFKTNVTVLNGDSSYWEKQKDSKQNPINGFFPWVDDEIFNSSYYKEFPKDRIGIPQGGALSGLISNIVLDTSDKILKEIDGLFYVRYCDDMILMHSDLAVCRQAIEAFKNSIHGLNLFSHQFKNNFFLPSKNFRNKKTKSNRTFETLSSIQFNRSFEFSTKSFWASKSKGPYKWGQINKDTNTLPWIGFVGYEINFNCETRIRKKSLRKELEKQKKIVTSIIKRIKKNKKRVRLNTIYRSALEKLNGMSVGRIRLYNYATCENKICWADGYQCLNLNTYTKKQLRTLDRNKYKFLNILTHHLGVEHVKSKVSENNDDIVQMKKPFSYYYQAGEKKFESNEA
jgi:Reverse transcriptase (RNA-dependent DNA polymerase)